MMPFYFRSGVLVGYQRREDGEGRKEAAWFLLGNYSKAYDLAVINGARKDEGDG